MDPSTTEHELKNMSHNILWIRQQYRLSQKQLAQCLGISVGSLRTLEKGILPPRLSVAFIFQIQKLYHIPPGKLFSSRYG